MSSLPVKTLSDLLVEMPQASGIWAVDVVRQQMHRSLGDGRWEAVPVSTSRFGIGSTPDSLQTPAGWHRIREVIGQGAPIDQEFVCRVPVSPTNRDDRILSRILWMDGLEPGVNDTSHARFIYIHGTNHIDLLGTPASQGCIRMAPEVIAAWADSLHSPWPLVWLGEVKR